MKTQSSSSEGLDPLSVLQNEMSEKYTEALITYYIALHYIQEQSTVKAMVILQVCQYRIEEAIEFAQDNMSNLKGEKTQSMISISVMIFWVRLIMFFANVTLNI